MKKCTQCGFKPMIQTKQCPKCNGEMIDADKDYGKIVFRGKGFYSTDR